MAFAQGPMGEMNTTPLIDVLLVLMIMFILSVPAALNSVPVDLPSDCPDCSRPLPDKLKNRLTLDAQDHVFWNGTRISQAQLPGLLDITRQMAIEPELQFAPDARASYDVAARTLAAIHDSGVRNFGFVGNERFRAFDKAG